MRLELRSIVAPGDLANERLTLRVRQEADLADFLIFRGELEEGNLSTDVINPIWFPFKPVEKGDLVVIYTKRGNPSEKKLTTGKIAHFYYMNESKPIWNKDHCAPVILHAPHWEYKAVESLVKKEN